MMAPKVSAGSREVKIGDLNEAFLLPRQRVAVCCDDDIRNIPKQKSLIGSPESEAKGPHGHGIAEHSRR
jgi:hypothetical protein